MIQFGSLASIFATGSISNLLSNTQSVLGAWAMVIVAIIGLVMIIVGVYQVAKNLISHGKGQNNWVVTICLLLIGGVLAIIGGWQVLGNILGVGKETVNELMNGQTSNLESESQVTDPFGGSNKATRQEGG